MDGFELLFILLVILYPLLEGLARRRKASRDAEGPPESRRAGPLEGGTSAPEEETARAGTDRGEAASDILPDDLWELLTGEQRRGRGARPPIEPDVDGGVKDETAWASTESPIAVDEDAARERWTGPSDDEVPRSEPVSLEYEGPEAYSLEQPPPSPEVRHARFHARLDAAPTPRSRPRRRSGLTRRLARRGTLREAVILAEVLGPPRGLE